MTDPEDIPCWQRLTPQITTSGKLAADDIDRLAAIGVRQVINLALAESPGALAGEAELLAAQGIGYSHIPVPFDAPAESHFAEFCAALAAAEQPLHVHCIMNWRVSAMFYRWHRELVGMDEASARALMVQQWEPETSTYPGAEAWARFLAGQSAA